MFAVFVICLQNYKKLQENVLIHIKKIYQNVFKIKFLHLKKCD